MIELATFEQLALRIGLKKAETNYPELSIIHQGVVSAFEQLTRRKFEITARSHIIFFESMTNMIALEAVPVQTVTSVSVNGVIIGTDEYKITDYGIRLNKDVKQCEVVVDYLGGLPSIPPNLNYAAVLQIGFDYTHKFSTGLQNTSNDGGSVSKERQGLLKEVRELLVDLNHPYYY